MNSVYIIKPEFKTCNSDIVWNTVVKYITLNGSFNSVKGISYKATVINDTISFIGGKEGTRLARKGNHYTKAEFIEVFDKIKECEYFNTNTINDRQFISMSFSYKRAPFIGLLYTVGIAIR